LKMTEFSKAASSDILDVNKTGTDTVASDTLGEVWNVRITCEKPACDLAFAFRGGAAG